MVKALQIDIKNHLSKKKRELCVELISEKICCFFYEFWNENWTSKKETNPHSECFIVFIQKMEENLFGLIFRKSII